ncbi:type II toxin-antitoxin system CcdA family antitoxin [Rhodobium gokarnense]|uniref:Antitoxin CcdA n=1 Tax=Rhodobium gokarnense TaxID=364296 RepID=A0ABT3H961_9HYPH|nr:type II toxin-antitoxin system CcdA family antitoxin [Rhodobium gokarnense]MCW2306908.1 antitoxin CcdA [Rhodobium gokarnense]
MKRAANLSIDAALLDEAKGLGITLSQVLESALRDEVRKVRVERWQAENRAAFDSYAEAIERDGVFSDGIRGF